MKVNLKNDSHPHLLDETHLQQEASQKRMTERRRSLSTPTPWNDADG